MNLENRQSSVTNKRNNDWSEKDDQRFRHVLLEGSQSFHLPIESHIIDNFSLYAKELVLTNNSLNLTAITEASEVAEKHFLDSILPLLASSIQDLTSNSIKVADIGTGAGFPGLPLAIMYPSWQVTLLDSLQKRCRFLEQLANQLDLSNTQVIHGRVEELGRQKELREQFDLVMARAVARLPVLVEYCLPFVKKDGLFIAMKGPEGKDEIVEAQKAISLLGGSVEWVEENTLPLSGDKRILICIRKENSTPHTFPRKAGVPSKKPIL
ncbi:16S rRNA (guanine(527)-N(7))-methyltransferase RsmG [Heliorestis convoluta]|uniref:Ribosomal RNA small subunit methyltransferase G n=1 Tax=Heliorestis convoluta TaxID=356322 RepID=A0A5Q2MWQ9_9FIRM|nr:16S rRNA (guanine(527)-N(7))-methyltransferase RsmG [Heliorestis convoluta]QGG46994.1 Ribosomal RNA small subunit methyltransferase [Heliorestis convoluta]